MFYIFVLFCFSAQFQIILEKKPNAELHILRDAVDDIYVQIYPLSYIVITHILSERNVCLTYV